jgi:hypothetical protein
MCVGEVVKPRTLQSIVAMTHRNTQAGIFGAHMTTEANNSMCGRNLSVQDFLEKTPFGYLLFIDCDQTFPPDTALRLMKHDKDIVGATYRLRGGDHHMLLFPLPGRSLTLEDTGLHEVAAVPTGCLLIKRSVFATQPHSWFTYTPDQDIPGAFLSDDTSFCKRMREEHGLQVHVDMDLTRQVGHMTNQELTYSWPQV